MPPRGTEGLDFTPILTHYLFLFTSILAIVGWFLAFIAQAIATADLGHTRVGVLWFAIFLQLFLTLGVLHTLASDSIAMHRFQISVFGAAAIVFAVIGVNKGIFTGYASLDAMAAGWLILAVVDILWVLFFTSEEDSFMYYLFSLLGTGGLTPPSRRRRATRAASMHTMGAGNGYQSGFAPTPSGGMVTGYDAKIASSLGGPIGSGNSFHAGSAEGPQRSIAGTGSIHNAAGVAERVPSPNSPLMGSGTPAIAPVSTPPAAGSPTSQTTTIPPENFVYRAKALYSYTANPEDPNEISFSKGEVLEILDKQGKWWQAKKADGSVGIAPSNYLQII
ncbi:hypothetical protein WOLCODRAFT_148102 [Wolfiporia cocos MD-104 SS10]|uniref:SH3 domain-containing protein n=1 Tax=Wolfiporia cocos (strain MD-104) TaxID=742152 RepID=A0A2H3IVP9_WOLCO|nr:hypothetical protein WOLCODRAFT_148102 [Wolfiporia cocos MD-104 SS10]